MIRDSEIAKVFSTPDGGIGDYPTHRRAQIVTSLAEIVAAGLAWRARGT